MILLQPCWILPKPTALFCMSENAVFCPTELSALIMKDNGKRKHVVRRALMPLDLGCPKQNHNPVVQFASHTPYLDDIFVLFLFCFCFVLTEKYFPAVFRQSDTISLWICQCDTNDRVETVQHSPTWWLFFLRVQIAYQRDLIKHFSMDCKTSMGQTNWKSRKRSYHRTNGYFHTLRLFSPRSPGISNCNRLGAENLG